MSKHHIRLTKEEARWVAMITFDVRNLHHTKRLEAWNANEEPILRLVESLGRRDAIPEPRRRYWADPEYNTGRGTRSRKGVFERNGCKGKDIYRNAGFLPYLRYFLFGADLDEKIIKEFEHQVEDLEPITSGDINPICACARRLTQEHRLERKTAAEEFFKLCLDMDLDVHTAAAVRDTVMMARR